MFRYLVNELAYRRGRSLVTGLSIALAVGAALLLTSLAGSYARALRVPIETIGADVIAQQQGDIPPKLEGLVFPHPNALIPEDVGRKISSLAGVIAVTRAVYMWDLEPDRYESILGIDDGDAGLGGLNERLIDGKGIAADSRTVLADSDFARKNEVKVGDNLQVGAEAFRVAGIVDAARSGKLVRADVYMPLTLAQGLAAAAPQVQALYKFGPGDANLLLIKAQRERLQDVVDSVTAILGKKSIVSSELSMRQALSGVMFLSGSMSAIVASVIAVFAAAFVWRATATSVAERRRELAILQAIGWSWRHISEQVLLENLTLAAVGTAIGVAITIAGVLALGHVSITLDLPWDLSSTPHFVPTAAVDRTTTITAPISVSWVVAGLVVTCSLLVSALCAASVLALPRPQPWALLRAD